MWTEDCHKGTPWTPELMPLEELYAQAFIPRGDTTRPALKRAIAHIDSAKVLMFEIIVEDFDQCAYNIYAAKGTKQLHQLKTYPSVRFKLDVLPAAASEKSRQYWYNKGYRYQLVIGARFDEFGRYVAAREAELGSSRTANGSMPRDARWDPVRYFTVHLIDLASGQVVASSKEKEWSSSRSPFKLMDVRMACDLARAQRLKLARKHKREEEAEQRKAEKAAKRAARNGK